MGKAKKIKTSQKVSQLGLQQDIESTKFAKAKTRNKSKFQSRKEDDEYVDANLSRKIIAAARDQLREVDDEFPSLEQASCSKNVIKLGDLDESEPEEDEDDLEPDTFYENIEINEQDEWAVEQFMNKNPAPRRTLADYVLEKCTEKQTLLEEQFSDAGTARIEDLDPKVIAAYKSVGEVLKHYRSGKLPKFFKFLPTLKNWEQVLDVTDPPSWSSAAMYEATRIFASNLTDSGVINFYKYVLLPRIRDEISDYKRLNFHLYQALKKALYKPGAFMKGIVMSLCESGTCTLREAVIVGSVLARNAIPAKHSRTALLKIAELEYNGANSIFMRILIDKKYSLPLEVIQVLIRHFARFRNDDRVLPVLWHQTLLTFVERYKINFDKKERDVLLHLLQKHKHPQITLEVKRELDSIKLEENLDMDME